jgi:hypothetical protein
MDVRDKPIMKKLLIPEFIQSIHQTLLLACLEYYIVFEADALLKLDTNLTGKVKCKRNMFYILMCKCSSFRNNDKNVHGRS